jgi:hypothetical protein
VLNGEEEAKRLTSPAEASKGREALVIGLE